ncbi:MAG: hypothetical protein D6770_08845 [Anaerolineae bacterium]|nr:MAG: hypothetical protein D6770_08845 [Anaerolineae bacterium]
MITKAPLSTLSRAALFALLIVAAAFVLLAWQADTVHAQAPTPSDDEVNAIARQLYCPVCENTPLDVCPTEACRQWRELIRQKLAEGWTEEQIKQYFVENYGARVLAEPPRQGVFWLAYIVPPIAILAGAFILYRALKAWNRPEAAAPGVGESEATPVQDEYMARLEEELRKRE